MKKLTKLMLTLTLLVVGMGANSVKAADVKTPLLLLRNGVINSSDFDITPIAPSTLTTDNLYAATFTSKGGYCNTFKYENLNVSDYDKAVITYTIEAGNGDWEINLPSGSFTALPIGSNQEYEISLDGVDTYPDFTVFSWNHTGKSITISEVCLVKSTFDTSKNHMLRFNNGTAGANPWDHQAHYTLPTALTAGKNYTFEAIINAVNGGETRLVPNVNGSSSQYLTSKGLWTNEFTRYRVEFKASAAHTKLEIDLGPCGGEVYFDNVSLVEEGETTNLIENGDFETQGTAGWSTVNNTMLQVENDLGEINEPGILVSVGEAGWKTFRTGSNVKVSDPSVKAYGAKYMSEGNYVKLTEVTEFTSWQSVVIQAPQGNYLLKSPATATSISSSINDLKANGGTPLPGDGTLYGLAKKGGVVGFYRIATTSEVPAWAIYLQIPAAAGREFVGFADDATTIKAVENLKQSGLIYNLAGQHVKNAKKGVFIVNGKKVIK